MKLTNTLERMSWLFLSLIILLSACGQKRTNTEGTATDSTYVGYDEVNGQFVKSLAEHPEMMDIKAEDIYEKYGVSVDESDDKQLRLYSWEFDNGMGGRYSNYTRQAYQYRGVSGVHTVGDYLASIFPEGDSPFLDGNTSVGEIMTFKRQNGGNLYVVPYHVVAAGGLTVYSFCAVTVDGDKLEPVAVFPADERKAKKCVLSRELDFMLAPGQMHEQGTWEDPYMKRGNNLWVKTEQVENAFYNVYHFDGKSFENIGDTK